MKTLIIALTCSLTAAACGSSSTRPAHDATSGTEATASTQSSTAAAQPALATSQSAYATADTTVETRAMHDKKANGASPYAATKPVTTAVEANPGVTDETKTADNTKTNTRDRHNSLTPMDQGNSAAETKITANIRKGIMGEKNVSFTGKNVKIITVGTRVTLRGPVKDDKERAVIEGIAKRTAGVSDVDNQLEISN